MKIIKFFLIINILFIHSTSYANDDFSEWVLTFKKRALSEGISK